MNDPDSTPDFVTLSRLLKQLDHADNKRLIAARDKFDLNQLSSSSSQTTRSNPNLESTSHLAFNIDHALMSENDGKNRYTDIVSYDEALLPSPYLNASLIPCPTSTSTSTSTLPSYISTQAPLPSTFPTFFHHLVSQRVTLILMLTPLVESGRRKAQQYWPDPNEKIRDSGQGWRIELISESVERDQEKDWECFFRKLKVFSSEDEGEGGEKGYEFDQIHVTSWADQGSSSQESLKRILDLMDHYSSKSNSGTQSNGTHSISNNTPSPILVHCSAGVGRSGTVISSHILRHLSRFKIQISTSSIQSYLSIRNKNGKDVVEDGDEDFKLKKYSDQSPYLIVKFIRFFRPRMVQTPAQLEMVWNHWKEEERINSIRK